MLKFPIFVDLNDNNIVIVGGDEYAANAAYLFKQFGAKITIISPSLCPKLEDMVKEGWIRHITRKYFRGDAANCYMCVAATDNKETNIAISVECKHRHIPVNVANPSAYGTFDLPEIIAGDDFVGGFLAEDREGLKRMCETLQKKTDSLWNESQK